MSTHSYIGVIEEDGTLKYVYCHSDGYPSYLGRMLLTYYNTPELATGLVNLGDLSMVRSMLRKRLVPDKGEFHTFKKPVREGPKGGITTAYHRDRKEMMFSTAVCGFGKDRSLLQISAMPARFLRATVPWSPIKTAFGVTFMLRLKRKVHMNRVFCVDRIVTLFLSVKNQKLFSILSLD